MKKYRAIAKTGDNPDGSARCVRYCVNNLVKFAEFLDREHPTWRWVNVYEYRKDAQGRQLGSFTRNNRPTQPYPFG